MKDTPEQTELEDLSEPTFPWYQGGLRFECTQCGNCCSGPQTGFVWVDEAEILALATAMDMQDRLEEFEKKFLRRIGTRLSLVEYSDGDCIFLDPKSRGCSVYAARPGQCRSWPFWHGNLQAPQTWALAARSCPGCNHGPLFKLDQILKIATPP